MFQIYEGSRLVGNGSQRLNGKKEPKPVIDEKLSRLFRESKVPGWMKRGDYDSFGEFVNTKRLKKESISNNPKMEVDCADVQEPRQKRAKKQVSINQFLTVKSNPVLAKDETKQGSSDKEASPSCVKSQEVVLNQIKLDRFLRPMERPTNEKKMGQPSVNDQVSSNKTVEEGNSALKQIYLREKAEALGLDQKSGRLIRGEKIKSSEKVEARRQIVGSVESDEEQVEGGSEMLVDEVSDPSEMKKIIRQRSGNFDKPISKKRQQTLVAEDESMLTEEWISLFKILADLKIE